jgi:hypothetical protein
MTIENIQRVMGRAITDLEFRKLLFEDPDQIIREYDLDAEDVDVIHGLDREEFEQFAAMFDLGIIQNLNAEETSEYVAELEERVSRAGLQIHTGILCMGGGQQIVRGFTGTVMDGIRTHPTALC